MKTTFQLVLLTFSIFCTLSCSKESSLPKTLLLEDLETARSSGTPADISTGLFAYYPFSGNPNDFSGNNLHGTPQNVSLTSDRKGRKNSAYFFNNKLFDSRITIPGDARFSLNNDFTISFWVIPTEFTSNNIETDPFISVLYQRAKWGFNAGKTSSSPLTFTIGFGSLYVTPQSAGSAAELKLNTWKHSVVTYEKASGTIRYYFNGVLAKEQTSLDLGLAPTDIEVTVGGNYNFTGLVGKIDELRFYNRALTQNDIKFLYNQ
jgi:hypothetical protein